jgi:hypothetical protein
MPTQIGEHIFMREEMSFDMFLVLPSRFAKPLETNFFCFAKLVCQSAGDALIILAATLSKLRFL